MKDSEIIERIQGLLGGRVLAIANPSERRIFMTVAPGDLRGAVLALRDSLGFAYLATISGVDKGETFEIVYHFASPVVNINLRTEFPRSEPRIGSICAVISGAVLYEREIQEMFGITVEGIPDPRRLNLPDGWPEGQYPLRKDWKYERPQEVIPGGKS